MEFVAASWCTKWLRIDETIRNLTSGDADGFVKFRSSRGASHQPAFMSSCLTISHTCLPCLPIGRTLLFWSDLFVVGRLVSWERWESGELGWWERCMRVVR